MAEIAYHFQLSDGAESSYRFEFDDRGFLIRPDETPPDWARLEQHQCANCPLHSNEHPYCPAAKNLASVVGETRHRISHEAARIVVKTPQRIYVKDASLQEGLFSLFGLVMATSGCPHLDFLRPLAQLHLPFASMQETYLRVVGYYMIDQYLRVKKQGDAALSLDDLRARYDELATLNRGFLKRINSITEGDADKNALITLHSLSELFGHEAQNDFSILDSLFQRDDAA